MVGSRDGANKVQNEPGICFCAREKKESLDNVGAIYQGNRINLKALALATSGTT